jgi:hypothetical protein
MRVIRDLAALESAGHEVGDEAVRALTLRRLNYLRDTADEEAGDEFILVLVEPHDTLDAVDAAVQSSLLNNPFAGTRYGDKAFVPGFETLEEHPTFYDATFILGDGALCIELIVPKVAGIDPRLLDLCAKHASPAPETAP